VDLSERATGIGALADPTRRALYEFVAARPDAVGREEAARALNLPPHTVNFHLDKLVEVGILTAEYRRLSGRGGPGAGRPSKLYRRARRQWTVSLPERRYDLIGQILADGVEAARAGAAPLEVAIERAAATAGREMGAAAPGDLPADLAALATALAAQGFEPRVSGDTVVLANCPFDALAKTHTELICGVNQHFVQGVADGLGCSRVTAHLDPEPGLCCVKVQRQS
jgi:predicted ArsR family transcriptional regulator